jgi:hypothetical protein
LILDGKEQPCIPRGRLPHSLVNNSWVSEGIHNPESVYNDKASYPLSKAGEVTYANAPLYLAGRLFSRPACHRGTETQN